MRVPIYVILTITGVVISVLSLISFFSTQMFIKNSEHAQARIVSFRKATSFYQEVNYPTLEYVSKQRGKLQAEARTNHSPGSTNQEVWVFINPNDPTVIKLDSASGLWAQSIVLAVIGITLGLAGAIPLMFSLRRIF